LAAPLPLSPQRSRILEADSANYHIAIKADEVLQRLSIKPIFTWPCSSHLYFGLYPSSVICFRLIQDNEKPRRCGQCRGGSAGWTLLETCAGELTCLVNDGVSDSFLAPRSKKGPDGECNPRGHGRTPAGTDGEIRGQSERSERIATVDFYRQPGSLGADAHKKCPALGKRSNA
jgi:hypothetical protein